MNFLWLFLQICDFRTWKIKTTSHKTYWDNLQSMLMGLEITPRPCCGQITDPKHWYKGEEGGLNEAIFQIFEEKP